MSEIQLRHDWKRGKSAALFALPMNALLFEAHSIHRHVYDPKEVQTSR